MPQGTYSPGQCLQHVAWRFVTEPQLVCKVSLLSDPFALQRLRTTGLGKSWRKQMHSSRWHLGDTGWGGRHRRQMASALTRGLESAKGSQRTQDELDWDGREESMRLYSLEFGFLIMTSPPQKSMYGSDGGELLKIRKESRSTLSSPRMAIRSSPCDFCLSLCHSPAQHLLTFPLCRIPFLRWWQRNYLYFTTLFKKL